MGGERLSTSQPDAVAEGCQPDAKHMARASWQRGALKQGEACHAKAGVSQAQSAGAAARVGIGSCSQATAAAAPG